ncbi:protein arginine kinase [candidate division WOR-3 bacterium 4484_100]|uniref:Protein arginine kinase n=1 Tax=candidate division WOR-3 bacterium 4484_100 TaxID=1936077 RepID=A0A1V4QHZ7_UNCW3|nr:MAG: protein arginine kinase [candidate division WOR-3 bacterium 4484_100]
MLDNIRWLIPAQKDNQGENPEIIVSSRIRVARNLDSIPFEIKMKNDDALRLLELTRSVIKQRLKGKFYELQKLTPLEKESLLECHLISPGFIKKDSPVGVFINDKGNISVMINEEDHLRIQGLSGGLNLVNISEQVFDVEEVFGKELGYAFSENYGFLTSCPTNLGTGLRASVILHLPGLVFTNEVDKVLKGAVQIGMAVRGIYGEGSEIKGSLFQISNQYTLGLKEEELIEQIIKLTHMIIDIELKARDVILKKARYEFEDKVFRSLGVLKSARIISTDEVLNLLSALRFGIGMGLIKDIPLDLVNELLIVSRPANIQLYYGVVLEEYERDIRRAEYIRNRLNNPESHT